MFASVANKKGSSEYISLRRAAALMLLCAHKKKMSVSDTPVICLARGWIKTGMPVGYDRDNPIENDFDPLRLKM